MFSRATPEALKAEEEKLGKQLHQLKVELEVSNSQAQSGNWEGGGGLVSEVSAVGMGGRGSFSGYVYWMYYATCQSKPCLGRQYVATEWITYRSLGSRCCALTTRFLVSSPVLRLQAVRFCL